MVDKEPLVSIALVTYQNASYLRESIDGILAQTYSNIEVIISDDGSTDESIEIINEYASKHDNIKVLKAAANRGISENINIALEHCNGEYICVIAGDDGMYPQKIEKQVQFLENNKNFELCFHNVDVYDDDTGNILYKWLDKYTPTRFPPDALYRANWYFRKDNRKTPSGSWFGRASYIKHSVNDKRTSQYHEFLYTMGMYASNPDGKWYTLPEVLGKYRVHSKSLSSNKVNWQKVAEEITVCYGLASVKFPQYAKEIQSEEANWWFLQLLYKQIPEELYSVYTRRFIRNFGIRRYLYLICCKILLSKAFTPVRKIFRLRN